jgi:hypothetical protein
MKLAKETAHKNNILEQASNTQLFMKSLDALDGEGYSLAKTGFYYAVKMLQEQCCFLFKFNTPVF